MERFKQGLADAFGAIPKNKDSANEVKDSFASHLERYPFLTKVEDLTKRKREEVVGVILLGLFLLMLAGVFVKPLGIFMTRLFGFAYPAYKSFKAIESTEKDDDTQWLIYWMVFAVFSLLEDTILKSITPFAPFFFVWKIIFLLWCYLPQTHGAEFLYTEIVSPGLKQLSETIESKMKPKIE